MGSISRDRFQMAFEISQQAQIDGDFDLARRAIEQTRADARILYPRDRSQAGSIEVFRARIALDQDDLEGAETAAIAANRIFEEIGAGSSERAIGEITLAQSLARKGETERASLVARTAEARLGEDPAVEGHPLRIVLAGLAEVEAASGNLQSARSYYQAALEVPAVDYEPDRILVRQTTRDLRSLDDPAPDDGPPTP